MHRCTKNCLAGRTIATQTEGFTSTKESPKKVIPQDICTSQTRMHLSMQITGARMGRSAGRLKVATNSDGNAHLEGKAYQLVASNGEVNAMPFYYLGRGERNPHSLQQPRGDTCTREVL